MKMNDVKRVLCFFAHPDDETLAAGATISKLLRAGTEVFFAIPATGVLARRDVDDKDAALSALQEDCRNALGVLGVKPENISLGEFADNELDKYTLLQLIQWLEPIIGRVKPDMILTHHKFCTNIDHQYCHDAVVIATRPSIDQHVTVICGEVPSSTGYLRPTQWEPNLYVDVDLEDVERKVKAMMTYKGECRPDPHPRSPEVLRALAKVRGSEGGCFFAEAFMIQKTSW